MAGEFRSKVRPLPGLFPAAPTSVPSLASIQAGAAEFGGLPEVAREFDVFISHASEDKESVVRPLAHELRSLGLSVWYDEFELRIADSLRRKIDGGLANSRFGVVVLSQAFFAKNWPQYELDGLVTREMNGQQVVLPIWHNISKDEIIAQSPPLADKVALSTSIRTVGEIAAEIHGVIRQPNAA
jgi:hypothetical protein